MSKQLEPFLLVFCGDVGWAACLFWGSVWWCLQFEDCKTAFSLRVKA